MRIKRTRSLGALAVSVSLLAAACGGSSGTGGGTTPGSSSSPQSQGNLPKGGTLKIVAQSDVGNLDTSQAYEVVAWTLFRGVTRQLVSYAGDPRGLSSDTDAKDDLATSHTVSSDGLTYTFNLRDNIHYAGASTRAIKAADFEYAIKRLCDPNGASGAIGYYTQTIEGLDTFCTGFGKVKTGDAAAVKTYIDGNDITGMTEPNDKTVVFKLKQKAGDFLNILALPFATPVPEDVLSPYLTDSAEMRQHFVSSGPYYVKTYTPDKLFDIQRTPSYDAAGDPLRKAYVDAISVNETVGSDQSEFEQIQAGTADLSLDVTTPPAATVLALAQTKDPTLRVTPEGRIDYMVFNLKKTATSDCSKALQKPQVRQAFNYAVNKQSLVQVKGGSNFAMPSGQILTSTITGYKKIDPYGANNGAGDPTKAKQMLADAGYPNGLTCTILYRPKNKGTDFVTALKQDLAKSGITLNLNMAQNSDYYGKHLQKVALNDWDVTSSTGWSPDWQGNAARSFFVPLLDSKASPCEDGTSNYGCFDNSGINAMVDDALATDNPADKWAATDAATMQDPPWVPFVEENAVTISSKRIQGFRWFNFSDNADIANVSVGGS